MYARFTFTLTLTCLAMVFGCGGSDSATAPSDYQFNSRFSEFSGESSVDYSGQVLRHLLLAEIDRKIETIDPTGANTSGQFQALLNRFYDASGFGVNADGILLTEATPITIEVSGSLDWEQDTLGDIGSIKSIQQKMPENDGGFTGNVQGWEGDTLAPHALVQTLFSRLDALIVGRQSNASFDSDPNGNDVSLIYVSGSGIDYRAFIQHFLRGAFAYSQASADYLSDASLEDADNNEAVSTKPYTELEHAWDEGFGYFGAARFYGDFRDAELAGAQNGTRSAYEHGYFDEDRNDEIDLLREFNTGASVLAGARDDDSSSAAPTDFTGDAWDAFIEGRFLIANARANLTDAELEELKAHRDDALLAWEKTLAATMVHHANGLLRQLNAAGSADFSFTEYARHFSSLKGIGLALQFNPNNRLSSTSFSELHERLGDEPVAIDAGETAVTDYKIDIQSIKSTILAITYGFEQDNIGASDGSDGW